MNDMTQAAPAKPKPRPRPQVMKLTDAAATRISELTTRADSEIVGLRLRRIRAAHACEGLTAAALPWTAIS